MNNQEVNPKTKSWSRHLEYNFLDGDGDTNLCIKVQGGYVSVCISITEMEQAFQVDIPIKEADTLFANLSNDTHELIR